MENVKSQIFKTAVNAFKYGRYGPLIVFAFV